MKKTLTLSLLLLLSLSAFGQVKMVPTTLSAAITTTNSLTVVVAAATGLNSNSYAIAANSTFLFVDGEFMAVNAVSGTTLSVTRGYGGSRAMTHASGAYVFAGPASFFSTSSTGLLPGGSCTRTNLVALPRPDVRSQSIFDCLNGAWVQGTSTALGNTQSKIVFPPTGGTAYTGINTNGTAPGANTEQYCTEVFVPYNKLLTGLGLLNGTTVGTDKHLVALYDGGGKLLANSATAGATTSGTSTYQAHNFTSTYFAVGPARYFACAQTNGTTDTIRMAITGVNDYILAGKITGVTFGTVANITPPTTFTSALGPYFQLY